MRSGGGRRPLRCLAAVAGLLLGAMAGAGCVPPAGGWDPAPLFAAQPELSAIPGQRIADLTPYPALPAPGATSNPEELLLVVCRHPSGSRVEIRPEGEDWPTPWAEQALAALAAERLGLALAWPERPPAGGASRGMDAPRPAPAPKSMPDLRGAFEAVVTVRSIAAPDAEGPSGLGDTLTLCDVSFPANAHAPDSISPRGVLLAAEIRLRRRLRRPDRRVHEASAAEWVAAFLHELGHALGFAGHAAVGESVVHREQSVLRGLARRALAGETLAAPNLTALHRLPPGRVLGRAALEPDGVVHRERMRAWVAARSRRAGPAHGPLASVGDREARIAWRWPDGFALDLRLPRYVEQLRRGEALTVEPGPRTQRALERGLLAHD